MKYTQHLGEKTKFSKNLIFIIRLGTSFAVTPLVAISVGANKFEECGIYFRQSLIVNLSFSVILLAVTFLCADLIVYFNQPPGVVVLATSYTKILGLSVIPTLFFHTYKQFIEGLSIMRPAMIVTLAANIINFIGNCSNLHLSIPYFYRR